jgi:hypothetical protein
VRRYKADMDDHRWPLTGEPIIFDSEGNLQDGQHRLAALAEAHVKHVGFTVVRGAAPDTFIVLDNGAVRKVSDTTGYTQHEATTGRAMMCGARHYWLAPSNGRMQDFIGQHYEAIKWATGIMTMGGGLKPIGVVRGAMARAYGHIDQERLDDFRHILSHAVDKDGWLTAADSAAVVLREELIGVIKHKPGTGYSPKLNYLNPVHIYRLTEVALDKFVKNTEVKRLRVPAVFVEMWPLPEDTDPALSKRDLHAS